MTQSIEAWVSWGWLVERGGGEVTCSQLTPVKWVHYGYWGGNNIPRLKTFTIPHAPTALTEAQFYTIQLWCELDLIQSGDEW